jgi:hypothetical protein
MLFHIKLFNSKSGLQHNFFFPALSSSSRHCHVKMNTLLWQGNWQLLEWFVYLVAKASGKHCSKVELECQQGFYSSNTA